MADLPARYRHRRLEREPLSSYPSRARRQPEPICPERPIMRGRSQPGALLPRRTGRRIFCAAATGRASRSAISASPPLRLWGSSASRLGGWATKAGNGRPQTSYRHPYSRSTTYLSCGMSSRRSGLSVSPFRRHLMLVKPGVAGRGSGPRADVPDRTGGLASGSPASVPLAGRLPGIRKASPAGERQERRWRPSRTA